ncbi:FapA family protein [Bacillus tianshenii]|nr:FapA family protein [Bacillus tianshenii]
MEILKNDYFTMTETDGKLYILVNRAGFLLQDFNQLLQKHPRLEISKFMNLRKALEEASGEEVEVGKLKPVASITITKDKMQAKVKVNETEETFLSNINGYKSMMIELLREQRVKDGIKVEVLSNPDITKKELVVAEGVEPVNGDDAIVRYYELAERKPKIREDGNADYYDMNFIDEVEKGAWLGEKIEPTDGFPGRTVTGEFLTPKKGKDRRLSYDKKTVAAVKEGGKTVLRAKTEGVVKVVDGKVSIGTHLTIDGDIGVETGNIEFEGSVEVRGTVQAGFSVVATSDVSILSELGIRGAKHIESRNGDVFIKGGVFGQGSTVIRAKRNIYLKHANECNLYAGEDINIGYYSIGSFLQATNVSTDDKKGKIIGGQIEAKGKVTSAYIGNKMERKTQINVQGFDRNAIKEELNELLVHYKTLVQEVEVLKRQLEIFESFLDQLEESQRKDYDKHLEKYEQLMTEIANIEQYRKTLMRMLETKGEGQVTILQQAYPEVMLEIKDLKKKLNRNTTGTFFALGKELHFE